jgi:hypothetical protein
LDRLRAVSESTRFRRTRWGVGVCGLESECCSAIDGQGKRNVRSEANLRFAADGLVPVVRTRYEMEQNTNQTRRTYAISCLFFNGASKPTSRERSWTSFQIADNATSDHILHTRAFVAFECSSSNLNTRSRSSGIVRKRWTWAIANLDG